jgi:hypothetical protein
MKDKEPQINITFWNFHLFAKGDAAVAALKFPVALGLLLVMAAIVCGFI